MSQFEFLKADFSPVFAHARKAEQLALSDPRGACFYARLALETAIKWMYEADPSLRSPYDDALSALIHEPSFRQLVGQKPHLGVSLSSAPPPIPTRRCVPVCSSRLPRQHRAHPMIGSL